MGTAIWKRMTTMYEGDVLYQRFWNFWVRAGVDAEPPERYFRDYEAGGSKIDELLRSVGFNWRKAETEDEVWKRIGLVWTWCKTNVTNDPAAYSTISTVAHEWPSILDYANYYLAFHEIPCGTCFPHAHIFATILGRIVYPRYRFAIASAHHTENGAPPTASHVYVAVYVADRWFYIDPSAINSVDFPIYSQRRSIGVPSFTKVDYEHPFSIIPLPTSELNGVPHLGV